MENKLDKLGKLNSDVYDFLKKIKSIGSINWSLFEEILHKIESEKPIDENSKINELNFKIKVLQKQCKNQLYENNKIVKNIHSSFLKSQEDIINLSKPKESEKKKIMLRIGSQNLTMPISPSHDQNNKSKQVSNRESDAVEGIIYLTQILHNLSISENNNGVF